MGVDKQNFKYILGLDIGTTSVGWSVIDTDRNRIQDLGVRIFEIPEDPQSGASLAEPRRAARSARRRLARRKQRLNHLKEMFSDAGLLSNEEMKNILKTPHDPYEIRSRAITEKISAQELFIALYHIAKRRGYKSNRKSVEESDKTSDSSKVLSAISNNKKVLAETNGSVAEALNILATGKGHFRNKSGDYSNSFIRENYLHEAEEILGEQAKFYPEITDSFRRKLLFEEYFTDQNGRISFNYNNGKMNRQSVGAFAQRPFMTAELINKMRGHSELSNKPRAAKASYTFELFRLAQDIAHLKMNLRGEEYKLSENQINDIIEAAKNTQKLTYAKVREVTGFGKKSADYANFSFAYIRGKAPKRGEKKDGEFIAFSDEEIRAENEKNEFNKMPFYHAVKKALNDIPEAWNEISNNADKFDAIGEVLSTEYDDASISKRLQKAGFSYDVINKLLPINVSGFGNLALDEYAEITPYLLKLNTYDKAMELAGYHFAKTSTPKKKLRPLNESEQSKLTNPVVKRAISQSRKVINAVIDKYGSPWEIHLEAAGELGKNFRDRGKDKRSMDENQQRNEKIVARLRELGVVSPSGLQITKYKLYEEQGGRSAYFGNKFDLNMLVGDEHYAEIDHIIPFSRCGNDGLGNKVLVTSAENQEKRNLTPFEKWGGNTEKWNKIQDNVRRMGAKFYPFKKRDRILATSAPKEDWNVRALNDTRYISKFLSNFLKQNLEFRLDEEYERKHAHSRRQTVFTPTGFITTTLRRFYGLNGKNRDENLHHAVDAVIIATTNQGMIQKFTKLNQYWDTFGHISPKEIKDDDKLKQMFQLVDRTTGEVLDEISQNEFDEFLSSLAPWPNFRKEVNARAANMTFDGKKNITTDDHTFNLSIFRDQLREIYKDDPEFIKTLHPIFVSRMPRRKASGPAHAETIRSPKFKTKLNEKTGVFRAQRKQIESVNLKDLGNSALRDSDPALLKILRERLEKFHDDPQKAFAEPIYKPLKDGGKGPRVRAIRVYDNQPSGFEINHGKGFVNNGTTVRLDVFNRKGKFYFAPVYLQDLAKIESGKKFPQIFPTPTGRSAVEKTELNSIRESNGSILAKGENGFDKIMSVFPNDYIQIKFVDKNGNQEIREGYYAGYGIAVGQISIINHLTAGRKPDDAISAQSAKSIKKLDISILGDNYDWRNY